MYVIELEIPDGTIDILNLGKKNDINFINTCLSDDIRNGLGLIDGHYRITPQNLSGSSKLIL